MEQSLKIHHENSASPVFDRIVKVLGEFMECEISFILESDGLDLQLWLWNDEPSGWDRDEEK
jgi:hypothetical protein